MRTAATLLLMSAIVRSGPADEKPSVPKSGNQIVVYKLKHVTAAKAAEHLKRELSKDATLAGIVILPEEATNTLLVAAPREKALLLDLRVHSFDWAAFPRDPHPEFSRVSYVLAAFTESLDISKRVERWLAPKPPGFRSSQELSIIKALDTKVTVRFDKESLTDVLKKIAATADINIVLRHGLEEGVTAPEPRVTYAARDRKLGSVFTEILVPLKLGWTLQDEVLMIMNLRNLEQDSLVRIYPVADLGARLDDGDVIVDLEPVAERIRKNVTPASWKSKGGTAAIQPIRSRLSLGIRHTRSGHRQITEYLQKTRAAQVFEYRVKADAIETP